MGVEQIICIMILRDTVLMSGVHQQFNWHFCPRAEYMHPCFQVFPNSAAPKPRPFSTGPSLHHPLPECPYSGPTRGWDVGLRGLFGDWGFRGCVGGDEDMDLGVIEMRSYVFFFSSGV